MSPKITCLIHQHEKKIFFLSWVVTYRLTLIKLRENEADGREDEEWNENGNV